MGRPGWGTIVAAGGFLVVLIVGVILLFGGDSRPRRSKPRTHPLNPDSPHTPVAERRSVSREPLSEARPVTPIKPSPPRISGKVELPPHPPPFTRVPKTPEEPKPAPRQTEPKIEPAPKPAQPSDEEEEFRTFISKASSLRNKAMLVPCRDLIHFQGGGTVEGSVRKETDTAISIETRHGSLSVKKEQVLRIERGKGRGAEFLRRLKAASTDPDALADLMKWSREQHLAVQREYLCYRILTLDPDHAVARAELALLTEKDTQKTEEAKYPRETELEKASTKERESYFEQFGLVSEQKKERMTKAAAPYMRHAKQYLKGRNYPGVVMSCTRALEAQPGLLEALFLRAEARLQLGKEDEALEDYALAVREHPRDPGVYVRTGFAYLDILAFTWAEEDFKEALRLDPKYADARAGLAWVHLSKGERGKALEVAEAALDMAPDAPRVRRLYRELVRVLAGPAWSPDESFTKETRHYVVRTNVSAKAASLYARHLDAIRKVYYQHFGAKSRRSEKSRVYVFKTQKGFMDYSRIRNRNVSGLYSFYYRELRLFDAGKGSTLRTLYHEAFHQYLHQFVDRPPAWFNEGLAVFFESCRVEGNRVVQTNHVPPNHVRTVQGGGGTTIEKLMNLSYKDFQGTRAGTHYAQAWSLMYFFFNYERGKYLPHLRGYYQRLRKGADQDEAFGVTFGVSNLEEMEKEWRDFMSRIRFK